MKWIGRGVIAALFVAVVLSAQDSSGSDGPDMSKLYGPGGHVYGVTADGKYVRVPWDGPGGAR